MSDKTAPIFLDAMVRIDKLLPPGREMHIVPDAAGLTALTLVLQVAAVERFSATANVSPFRGGVRVQGNLHARIVQPSIVTFAPVTQDIDEPIDRVFMPASDKPRNLLPGAEIFVDLEDDVPDELDGPELDLTDLLIETIALAIDPYPRGPGESLEAMGIKTDGEEFSPFASLKLLKNKTDKQ